MAGDPNTDVPDAIEVVLVPLVKLRRRAADLLPLLPFTDETLADLIVCQGCDQMRLCAAHARTTDRRAC